MSLSGGLSNGLSSGLGGLGGESAASVPANALRASDGTPLRTPDGTYILVS